MKTFVVELKIRMVIKADNPGIAVSEVSRDIRETLAKMGPHLLNAEEMEAVAFLVNPAQ